MCARTIGVRLTGTPKAYALNAIMFFSGRWSATPCEANEVRIAHSYKKLYIFK